MCTNKFSIGGLIGVHVSSIVKWGYRDDFKLLFSAKNLEHAKT